MDFKPPNLFTVTEDKITDDDHARDEAPSPADTVILPTSDFMMQSSSNQEFGMVAEDSFYKRVPSNVSLLRCESVEKFLHLTEPSALLAAPSFSSLVESENVQCGTSYTSDLARQDTIIKTCDEMDVTQPGSKTTSLLLTPSLCQLLSSAYGNHESHLHSSSGGETNSCSMEARNSKNSVHQTPSSTTPCPVPKPNSVNVNTLEAVLHKIRNRSSATPSYTAGVSATANNRCFKPVTVASESEEYPSDDGDEACKSRESFRERNRLAAKKARHKKKQYLQELEAENDTLRHKMSESKAHIEELRRECLESRNLVSQLVAYFVNSDGSTNSGDSNSSSICHQCSHCGSFTPLHLSNIPLDDFHDVSESNEPVGGAGKYLAVGDSSRTDARRGRKRIFDQDATVSTESTPTSSLHNGSSCSSHNDRPLIRGSRVVSHSPGTHHKSQPHPRHI